MRARTADHAYCSLVLPTAYCLLPTAYCLLPTALCCLLFAVCSLLTAPSSLLVRAFIQMREQWEESEGGGQGRPIASRKKVLEMSPLDFLSLLLYKGRSRQLFYRVKPWRHSLRMPGLRSTPSLSQNPGPENFRRQLSRLIPQLTRGENK
jgi:hypothetical protein